MAIPPMFSLNRIINRSLRWRIWWSFTGVNQPTLLSRSDQMGWYHPSIIDNSQAIYYMCVQPLVVFPIRPWILINEKNTRARKLRNEPKDGPEYDDNIIPCTS